MNFVFIAFLFFIIINENIARECHCLLRDDVSERDATTIASTILKYDSEEIKELIKSNNAESATILVANISKQATESRKPFNVEGSSKMALDKAYACSKVDCPEGNIGSPVCACNFNTGNVASFKNKCDAQKHNCRFDTNFHVILNEICPWEFAFRRNKKYEFDYRDAKYYN